MILQPVSNVHWLWELLPRRNVEPYNGLWTWTHVSTSCWVQDSARSVFSCVGTRTTGSVWEYIQPRARTAAQIRHRVDLFRHLSRGGFPFVLFSSVLRGLRSPRSPRGVQMCMTSLHLYDIQNTILSTIYSDLTHRDINIMMYRVGPLDDGHNNMYVLL